MNQTTDTDSEKMSQWNDHFMEKIVSCAHGSLSRCLADLFINCRDPEFRRHPSATDLYTRYDALDALYTYKDSVARTFKDEFIKGVWNPRAKDAPGKHDDDDPYLPQIIETDTLELHEAVLPMLQRVEDAHKSALLHLDLRLNYLNEYLSEPIEPQGLHPTALLDAFEVAIGNLSLRLPGKILLCKIFAQEISAALEQLYLLLNKMLIDAGIIDNDSWIKTALTARKTGGKQSQQLLHADTKTNSDEPSLTNDLLAGTARDHAVHSATVFPMLEKATGNTANETLSGALTEDEFLHLLVEPNAPGSGSSLSKYQRSHLTAALSALQRETVKTGVALNVDELESAVTRLLYNSGIFNANELVAAEHHVISFVNQIFQTLLDGDSESGSVNPLIAKLLIPTIKLALLDFEFFKNPQHPAREFFNHLATLTIGVVDDSDPLTAKLQTIINKILSRFDTNVGVFEEPLQEIRGLAKSEAERIRKTEEKAQREAQIKARHSIARGTVTALIQRIIQNKELSRELKDFLQGCWAPYMALIFSTRGPRSRVWKDSVLIVRNLVEASQANRTQNHFDRLIGPTDAYCELIIERLAEFKLDQKNPLLIQRVCTWLQEFHERLVSAPPAVDERLPPILSVEDLSDDNLCDQPSTDLPAEKDTAAATCNTHTDTADPHSWESNPLPNQGVDEPELAAQGQATTQPIHYDNNHGAESENHADNHGTEPAYGDKHDAEPIYYDDEHGTEPEYYDDEHGTEPECYDDDHGVEPQYYDDDHGAEPVYFDDDHGAEPQYYDDDHGVEPVYFDDDHGIEESASEDLESHLRVIDSSANRPTADAAETSEENLAKEGQEHILQESRKEHVAYSSEAPRHADQRDSASGNESNIEELLSDIGNNAVYETDLDELLKSLPAHVRAGTWYEIYQSDDRAKRRLKLSAILEDTGQVLFANRLGESQLIIDLQTFLEDLQEGYSKPINDNNLFDRALTTVISTIRESQAQRS